MIQNSKTFAFSAENPTGVRAGGSQGGDCTKLRPTVTIPAGETVTLVDAAGPGVIQHMWFTGYVGHHFIIRMYWDDQEYPSVEAPQIQDRKPLRRYTWRKINNKPFPVIGNT